MMQENKKSGYTAEVVEVKLEPHFDADNLSIIPIHGYTYVGRTADWIGVKRAVYVPPDTIISTGRPEFATYADQTKNADGTLRVKAKKLRGVISFGLMIPVPDDTPLGEDWFERLGLVHYEPPTQEERQAKNQLNLGGEHDIEPPLQFGPYYELENGRRYGKQLFTPEEPVIAHEKLDGTNFRAVWHDGRYWVRGRNHWLKRTPDYSHLTVEGLVAQGVEQERAKLIIEKKMAAQPKVNGLWQVLERTEPLAKFLRDHPGTVVFGEIYGNVNNLKYGFPDGDRFAAFDIYRDGRFLDPLVAMNLTDHSNERFPWAPMIGPDGNLTTEPFPFDLESVCRIAEGGTLVDGAKKGVIREGCVISPVQGRWDARLGRVKLKFVSGAYLEKFR